MAGLTTDSLVDMNAVIEVNEIRQIVHARPTDRVPGAEARAHRLERRARAPDLRMAVHASLGWRNIGEARSLHCRMAIPAVDSEAAHMVRVAERHRLLTSLRLPRRITGAVELRKRPGE